MTAEDVKKFLGLVPHPREGGWYVRTYESGGAVAGECVCGWALCGAEADRDGDLLPAGAGTFSEMHRLKSDEIFHFYAGDAVRCCSCRRMGRGAVVTIGNRLAEGERPQVVVQRGVWQGSRLVPGGNVGAAGMHGEPGV